MIGVPTGAQDYYPAAYGGVNAVRLTPSGVIRERIRVDTVALLRRIVLAYTGAPRQSGINNWEVMKAHIDWQQAGVPKLCAHCRDCAAAATGDGAAGLGGSGSPDPAEWNHRKKNAPGITTPLIEHLTQVASRHGATAAKVCGAGGGGCVLFYVQDGAKQRVAQGLAAEGATVLPTGIATRGLTVQACPA